MNENSIVFTEEQLREMELFQAEMDKARIEFEKLPPEEQTRRKELAKELWRRGTNNGRIV